MRQNDRLMFWATIILFALIPVIGSCIVRI